MNPHASYILAIRFALVLLMVVEGLGACKPAVLQPTPLLPTSLPPTPLPPTLTPPPPAPTQPPGTAVTGRVTYTEKDYIREGLPNQIWWREGDDIHGRNLVSIGQADYTDDRLDGTMSCTYNIDGTRNPPNGVYGKYYGHCLMLDAEKNVTWEGDYSGDMDKQGNFLVKAVFHGLGNNANLMATLNITMAPNNEYLYNAEGMIGAEINE
jgi:hypothetical protein